MDSPLCMTIHSGLWVSYKDDPIPFEDDTEGKDWVYIQPWSLARTPKWIIKPRVVITGKALKWDSDEAREMRRSLESEEPRALLRIGK